MNSFSSPAYYTLLEVPAGRLDSSGFTNVSFNRHRTFCIARYQFTTGLLRTSVRSCVLSSRLQGSFPSPCKPKALRSISVFRKMADYSATRPAIWVCLLSASTSALFPCFSSVTACLCQGGRPHTLNPASLPPPLAYPLTNHSSTSSTTAAKVPCTRTSSTGPTWKAHSVTTPRRS